jgi:hypothetical protein
MWKYEYLHATLQFKVQWKGFKFLLEEMDLNTKLMKILNENNF